MPTILDGEPIVEFDLTEIIDGEEIVTPSPFSKHQNIISRLFRKIADHADTNDKGTVFVSPLDVILDETEKINRLQPDILFIRKENQSIIQDWIRGVPDLVIEVVSKGTLIRDTIKKKSVYERYGVPECWFVFPDLESIEVFVLENNRYELFSSAEIEGVVKSKVLEGFELDIKKIF